MTLDEALAFSEQKKIEGYRSDGCSYAPDLGLFKYCEMHDFLRVFKPSEMTAWEADKLFFRGICSKGIRYYPVACIYWCAVRAFYLLGFSLQRG